jgi:hypothetical protein
VLPHDSVLPDMSTVAHTRALLEHFNWELFNHPPYSPDLALSDYHLLTYLKDLVGSQYFNNNEEMIEDVKKWLSSQMADIFNTVIQKYDKYQVSILIVTMLRSSISVYIFFVNKLFFVACFVNSSSDVAF